jgi:anion-transporting  ArsA/GET3 family ATPase
MPAIELTDTTDPAESDSGNEETVSFESTHKQANCFRPEVDGKPAQLSTFRLRPDGHIVACVWPKSSKSGSAKQDDAESGDDTEIRGYVHVYNPDFELVDQFGLPFQPSALDVDSSGNMFVAGEGRIGRMARDGEIEIMADSPTLAGVDMEELKEEVRKEMKEQLDRSRKMYEKQIETFSEQISEIEATDENERSDSQNRRLKSLKAQVKNFEDYIQQQNDVNDQMIEYRLKSKSKITAVAVSDKDVFVATGARQGSGYEVYRMDRDLDDAEVLEIAIIENIQRADLNAVEEAAGYRQLMDVYGYTQEKMADVLGKSRSHIANLLRLLSLPEDVQDLVRNGKLSSGHARALITANDPSTLARQVAAQGLSVRATEKLAKSRKEGTPSSRQPAEKDADTKALEGDLSAALGMSVTLTHKPDGEAGQVVIQYKSLDQLDELCRMLSGG